MTATNPAGCPPCPGFSALGGSNTTQKQTTSTQDVSDAVYNLFAYLYRIASKPDLLDGLDRIRRLDIEGDLNQQHSNREEQLCEHGTATTSGALIRHRVTDSLARQGLDEDLHRHDEGLGGGEKSSGAAVGM
jgi:hypothetical protein